MTTGAAPLKDDQVLVIQSDCKVRKHWKTVSDVVDILSRELKLALIDIKSELNVSFKNLELVGGVSHVQNIGPYLTQALELPVNLFPIFFPRKVTIALKT